MLGRLGLDLLHEVVAEVAAGRVGKGLGPLLGQVVGLDQRAFLLQDLGPAEAGDGRDRVVAPLLHETLQGRLVERGLLLAHGLVVAETQPLDVGVQQGRLVLVVLMEAEQLLVKPDGLERGRIAIAALDLPGDELLDRPEDGAVGRKLEGVFGLGRRLLARVVELQGLVGHEVVERGPVAVGHGAFVQQVAEGLHGDLLELLLGGQGLLKMLVDLGKQPRQVPGGEILARRGRRRRALHEPPAVVLEVLPVPVGLDDLQHGLHFGGGLGDLGLQADDLLFRLVALDGAFQGDLAADGLDGHGVVLFGDRAVEDRLEMLDGRLRQALVARPHRPSSTGHPTSRRNTPFGGQSRPCSETWLRRVLIDGFLAEVCSGRGDNLTPGKNGRLPRTVDAPPAGKVPCVVRIGF